MINNDVGENKELLEGEKKKNNWKDIESLQKNLKMKKNSNEKSLMSSRT